MFELKREVLFAELLAELEAGSVLISGAPGIGKSWLIRRLLLHLRQHERFVLPLVAEEFQVSSAEELQRSLQLSEPIEVLLAKMKGAVLLIDGLDALRAESSQRVLRDLIIRVLREAPDVRVVASIRSFDLAESPVFSNLSRLVPGLGRPFRSLVVAPLSDEEISQVRRERPAFGEVWKLANGDTRQLLRVPFNLTIALSLLRDGFPSDSLSGIGSQVALLAEFWKRRVENVSDGLEKRKLLRLLAERMIQTQTLSVAEVDIDAIALASTMRSTLSAELLQKSVTGRLAFTHNILFDYAVARLLLDEVRLKPFLRQDSNRSLYYRPSLNFFFGHVWLAKRTLFWSIVEDSTAEDGLTDSVSVIPAVVVCQLSQSLDELAPLLSEVKESRSLFLRKVLLGLQALGAPPSRRNVWVDFVCALSKAPALSFINELLSAVTMLRDGMRLVEHERLNLTARRLMEWSWNDSHNLSVEQRTELAGVVSGRVLPVVLRTLKSAPRSSTILVESILKRIGKEGASSRELFWLANEMDSIVEFSPELAAGVYEAIYSHRETSEANVSIGSGSVMNLVSTERQQYQSLYYQLSARFRTLLERDFAVAARTAVRIANSEVLRERPLSQGEAWPITKMHVAGHTISYVADYSEIWDSGGGRDYTSLQMFDSVVRTAVNKSSEASAASELVETVLSNANVAVLYKKLFEQGSTSFGKMGVFLEPLVLAARFISAPEVTVAVGEYLKAVDQGDAADTEFWNRLTNAVLKIARCKPVLRYERPRSIQIRLLSCFRQRITSERAKAILEESEQPRPNRPYFRTSGGVISPDSPDIYWMRGIDPENPANQRLIAATDAVKLFAYSSPNSAPSIADVRANFTVVQALARLLSESEGAAPDLFVNARGTLYAAVSAMSQVAEIEKDGDLFKFVVSAAITGAQDPEPAFDPKYHLAFDSPGWGSPTPRIEAAQAIVNLVWNFREHDEALAAFRKLEIDAVPAVRYQIAHGLVALYLREKLRDEFWDTLRKMLVLESTNGVILGLLQSLGQIAGREPVRTMELLTEFVSKNYRESDRSDTMHFVVDIAAGLYLAQGTPEALSQIRVFESDLEKYQRELSHLVFTAGQQITPSNAPEEQRNRARGIWNGVLEAVLKHADVVKKQAAPRDFNAVVAVLDSLISRLFFAFDLMGSRAPGQNAMSQEQRAQLFGELKGFIERLVQAEIVDTFQDIPLIPHTAHYFLQLMNGILEFSPEDVLRYTYAICKRGARTGYLEDSLARSEAVKLVERALADFRDRLKKPTVAASVAGLLDLFTKHGWPEAVLLTFRLEDAFR